MPPFVPGMRKAIPMTEHTNKRIILSMERPDLEEWGRQFCAGLFPERDVEVIPVDHFLDRCQQDQIADEQLVIVLSADAKGHLAEGSPLVQQLMAAVTPVLVLRKPEGQELPVTSFERVVVPLDGSSIAGQAVPIASVVARSKNWPVKFVMVIDPNRVIPPAYAYDPEAWGVIEELRTTAHWALSQAEALMEKDGVSASSDLLLGSINASLMASMNSSDLVVMTTHGPSKQNVRYRESVARRVLMTTTQPILIMQGQPQASVVVDGHQASAWIEPLKSNTARIA